VSGVEVTVAFDESPVGYFQLRIKVKIGGYVRAPSFRSPDRD
jgi:hypothetical protein